MIVTRSNFIFLPQYRFLLPLTKQVKFILDFKNFKVVVDGKTYQPSVACDNKKKAKADAATYALQQLGFMAVDPNNPL